MKKNMKKGIAVICIIVAMGFGSWKANSLHQKNIKDVAPLFTENIEAQSGPWSSILEYWNRLDWNCVTVNCGFFYATAPEFAGEGKGTEAHSWSCVTCENMLQS